MLGRLLLGCRLRFLFTRCGRRSSYLWAITPAGQQFYELPGSETIVPLIQSHTKAILASKDVLAQENAPGRELYQALVKPVEGMIPKGGRVFIIGDEALSGLNFETLLAGNESPHFWIEDVAITNAKSLRLLSANSEKQERYADRRMLLIGDPVYRDNEYAKLPNAAQEVANVAGHFAADHRTGADGSAGFAGWLSRSSAGWVLVYPLRRSCHGQYDGPSRFGGGALAGPWGCGNL